MSIDRKPKLEVCLSPALLHLYDTKDAVVVIIDVFRATSTIAAALHNGAKSVIPVATVPECIELGSKTPNSITAGERDGKVAEGLQYGNSPSEYPTEFIKDKTLVLTTTNGTRLLHMVKDAAVIITGSFLNLQAVSEFLMGQNKNVLLGCAAWKDRFNMEDTLFAGAVVNAVKDSFSINCDSARAAYHLYQRTEGDDFISFLMDSSHYIRLSAYGLEKDMEYCSTPNLHPVVPILKGKELLIHS
ncbi:MAG: 2-phosphosulfolactate phosphatase [Bacteroidota bacterium]